MARPASDASTAATFVAGTFGTSEAGGLFGSPVRRLEDHDLLVGTARFVADLDIDGILELAFVRSNVARGRLLSVDTSAARAFPGVMAACSASELALPVFTPVVEVHPACNRPALARGEVRFVGDLVAVVAATTRGKAIDAAEAVIADIEPLPAAIGLENSLTADSPVLFETIGTNLIAGERSVDEADVLDDAEIVVRGRFENQRIAVVPMEGNAIAVVPGGENEEHELTIYLSTQFPHRSRRLAADAFGLPEETVRVVAPSVGGAFGGKLWAPEHLVAIALSRTLGRPVRWIESRHENLLSMAHSRAQVQYVELGLRRDGTITGLRCRILGDAGAYGGFGGAFAMGTTRTMAQGVYQIPKLAYAGAVVVTSTTPTGAYRGAGRPEAAAFLERIVDMAADELDLDPAELRRRNFIQPSQFPYATLTGVTYDSGDYEAALNEALHLAGYETLLEEQERRRTTADPIQLGIGMAVYVEITGASLGPEWSEVEVHTDGTATIKVGTSAHGQGHATTFSMLLADELGIPMEDIRFVQSDTAVIPRGGGTGGSRSGQVGGSAVVGAAGLVLERARVIASDMLESAPEDIVVTPEGHLAVAGVPASGLSWSAVATEAEKRGEALRASFDFDQKLPTFPFGAHVCVVEVDTETGRVEVRRHIAVDDCGRIINPLVVEGQVHGGVASGISQALWEHFIYDEAGNPLTSTLADYAMPSAAEFCSFETAHTQTPSPRNPLGVKGIGESGTVGSTPAAQNAVVDALSHLGVRHIDLPCNSERVWRAIQAARAGTLPSPWSEPPAPLESLPVRPMAGRPEDFSL